MHAPSFLFGLIVVWLAAKLAGEGVARLGHTVVIGELLAGVVIGPGALGIVTSTDFLNGLAEIGIVILLFEIGLESDLDALLRSGVQSVLVALAGVMSPFLLGFALARVWGCAPLTAIFVGATLTATSVGITARMLADLGQTRDRATQVVLGAAVVDDVLGLVALSVVAGLVRRESVSVIGAASLLVKACAFLVVAVVLGVRLAPRFIEWVDRMQIRGSLIVYAVIFCMLLAVLAETSGLAPLIGAFAAGLVLAKTERGIHIADRIKPVADLFVPIFFVIVGMKVNLSALHPLAPTGALAFAGLLTIVAIVSKLVAGFAVYQRAVPRWRVGVALIPRGEVGLVFAATGLAAAVIDTDLYAAVVMMIMLTTLIGPLWLKMLYRGADDRAG